MESKYDLKCGVVSDFKGKKHKVRLMHQKNGTALVVSENAIRILTDTGEISKSAIAVDSNFQIELGRSYNDFIDALAVANIPYVFIPVVKKNGIEIYNLVRMGTGNIPTVVILTVKAIDSIIVAISPNRKILDNKEYRRYCRIPKINKLSINANYKQQGYFSRYAQISMIVQCITDGILKTLIEKGKSLQINIYAGNKIYGYNYVLDETANSYKLVSIVLRLEQKELWEHTASK